MAGDTEREARVHSVSAHRGSDESMSFDHHSCDSFCVLSNELDREVLVAAAVGCAVQSLNLDSLFDHLESLSVRHRVSLCCAVHA